MSFGQEMKDFIGAAQAGQKMVGAASDEAYKKIKMRYQAAIAKTIEDKNTPEAKDLAKRQAEATLANTISNTNDAEDDELDRDTKRSSSELRRAQAARIRGMGAVPAPEPESELSGIKPSPRIGEEPDAAPAQAVPAPPQVVGEADPIEGPEAVPVAMASRGGTVQHFAGGGAVAADDGDDEEDDGDEDDPVQVASAAPAVGGAPAPAPTGKPGFSVDAAHDAVKAGLQHTVSALGLNSRAAVADPRRQRALQAYAQGAGAMDVKDMQAAQKAVDPQGVMGESERNLAALGAVYQFKMNKGDVEGAKRASASMIQYYRQASQRYAAITAAAVQHGDIDGAVKAAMKTYSNIPDGNDMKLVATPDGKISYSITNQQTGKVTSKGIADPAQMASAAMGVARGGFDKFLLDSAGQRAEKPAKAAVNPDAVPMKTADKTAALKGVGAAYDEQFPEGEKDKPAKYDASEKKIITGAAFRISAHSANSRLTHAEAVDFADRIADPTTSGEDKILTKKADGGYQVRVGKQEVFVPERDFDALLEKRTAKLAAKKTADDAAAADAKKPSNLSKAMEGAHDAADDLDAATGRKQAVPLKKPEAYGNDKEFNEPPRVMQRMGVPRAVAAPARTDTGNTDDR